MMLRGRRVRAQLNKGNNNAYCQDSGISWVNWDFNEAQEKQIAFFRRLTELLRTYPVLRRSRFFTGQPIADSTVKDVTWIDANGEEMNQEVWDNDLTRCFGMQLDGRAPVSGVKRTGDDATLLLVFNGYHDVVQFTLPDCEASSGWKLLFDTNDPDLEHKEFDIDAVYDTTGRSLLLFERVPGERKTPKKQSRLQNKIRRRLRLLTNLLPLRRWPKDRAFCVRPRAGEGSLSFARQTQSSGIKGFGEVDRRFDEEAHHAMRIVRESIGAIV